jgi:hypothetical protein
MGTTNRILEKRDYLGKTVAGNVSPEEPLTMIEASRACLCA